MKPIVWQRFNGLSDSLWSGIKDSFYKLVGLDIFSQPGSITVHQKLAKESGATVTALCRVALAVTDGSKLWFSYTDGKIWRESGGTYTLVHTTTPAAGSAGCLGAAEFNGFIYWATQSRLHRIAVGNIGSAASWTANAAEDWQTFSATDAEFHPMVVQNGSLYIGDANKVASVDSSASFAASDLDLIAPLRIKCMAAFDVDLVLGTIIDETVNYCQIVRWDTIQTSWQFAEPVWENGINAFLWTPEALLAQAGTSGNFYVYDGLKLQPYKKIPGTWTPSKYGEVYPNAVGMLKGIPVFGFSNGSGNPADQGVYEFGSYSKDYPKVMSLGFPISEGVSGVSIGAIIVDGQNMWVSWQNGATYGVDKLDYTAKYASAYLETVRITLSEENMHVINFFFANYQSLPSGTALALEYKKNNESSYTEMSEVDDSLNCRVYAEETVDARALQFRVEFTVSSNDAPVVEALGFVPSE